MILVDEHEPDNIFKLLNQICTAVRMPLNRQHRSDFWFGNYEGKTLQFSRKQAAELCGNIDEAEDQLRDYYDNADYNFQIIEGIISPIAFKGSSVQSHAKQTISTRDIGSKIFAYAVQPDGDISHGHSFSTINSSLLYAWEHRLWMAGVATIYTLNWQETARRLAAIYRNEQKPPEEHSTLKRIIKPRYHVVNEASMTDEQKSEYRLQKSLMALSDAYKIGVGEKKAAALASRYVNLMDIAVADMSDIAQTEGIGRTLATRLLEALGRTM